MPNFAASDQADLLDLVAKRYPGNRPSDFYGKLDDYSALQLDIAIALKGKIRDQEHESDLLYVILEGMRGIMRAQGAKPKAIDKPAKYVFGEQEEPEIPHVSDLLAALSGQGTING